MLIFLVSGSHVRSESVSVEPFGNAVSRCIALFPVPVVKNLIHIFAEIEGSDHKKISVKALTIAGKQMASGSVHR